MPESAENQTIEVYRCRSFPYEWELAAVPMQGILATDATLHHDGTRWWMFTNLAEPGRLPQRRTAPVSCPIASGPVDATPPQSRQIRHPECAIRRAPVLLARPFVSSGPGLLQALRICGLDQPR